MADIKIDGTTFTKRVKLIHDAIESKDPQLQGAESIFVLIGKVDDENPYRKSSVLHTWLLGYEFPSTALLITKSETIIITSAGKGTSRPWIFFLNCAFTNYCSKTLDTNSVRQCSNMDPIKGC